MISINFRLEARLKPAARHAIGVLVLVTGMPPMADAGDADTEPYYVPQSLLISPQPDYPAAARIGGIEGWCIVQFDVTESGDTENSSISSCEPTQVFEEAALSAMAEAKYKPATRGGAPVPVTAAKLKLRFVLAIGALDELEPGDRPDNAREILVMPLSPGPQDTDASNAPLTSAIVDVLAEDGYESQVMPVDDVKAVAEAMRNEVGGLFDPMTGKPDRRKIGLYTVKLIGAVSAAEFGAVIIPALEVRLASLERGWATWDGVTRNGKGYFGSGSGKKDGGTAFVVSVRISCFTPDGQLLFTRLGGLDFLFSGKGWLGIDPNRNPQVFKDRTKVREAVRVALAPLRPRAPDDQGAPGDSVASASDSSLTRQVRKPHQKLIHGPRALAAFADRPHHQ